jgi:DNA invertase Pin-like site-specific DNA recombinase
MKLDGYCRVSQVRDRAGESFISPDLQRQQIEGWARLHGHTIDAWHTDLDQSGGKMDRPDFIEMMSRVKSGQTQGIVVAKLDRFARSLPGALEAIKFLDEHSAAFVSVAEGVDPSTSAGKMMRNLLLVLAEFELDRVKDNWHAAISNAILERGVQPTVAPFGYRKDEHKRFVIDPDAGPYVREIFCRRLSGQTWTSIALWLNEEGIKPRSSAQWTGATVKQLTQRGLCRCCLEGKHSSGGRARAFGEQGGLPACKRDACQGQWRRGQQRHPPCTERDHPLRGLFAAHEWPWLQAQGSAAHHPVPVQSPPHSRDMSGARQRERLDDPALCRSRVLQAGRWRGS